MNARHWSNWAKSGRVLGLGLLLIGLAAGCNSDSDSETEVAISPSSVFLSADKVSVVTFTASGGDSNYVWSIANTNLGLSPSARGGDNVQAEHRCGTSAARSLLESLG